MIVMVVTSLIFLVFLVFIAANFALWLQAYLAGAKIDLIRLVAMRLRRVNPRSIVYSHIMAVKGGVDVGMDNLEAHHLARGNVQRVVMALIAAKKAHYPLTFAQAAAIDLAGRDPLDEVTEGDVDWEYEFDQMGPHTSKPIEGNCRDGSRVGASVKVRYSRAVKQGPSEEFPLQAEIATRALAYINDAESFSDLERARERHESQLLDFGKAAMRGRLKSLELRYFRR